MKIDKTKYNLEVVMSQKGKVLVIEDEQDWQDLLTEYLEEAGFHVTLVSGLEAGYKRVKEEMFHFATIDLQLDKNNQNPSEFEGWSILQKIVEYRADSYMPTMVITGFDSAYKEFSKIKHLEGTFFMAKKNFDKEKFLQTVQRAVETFGVRFRDDKKES